MFYSISKKTLWVLVFCICSVSLVEADSLPTYRIKVSERFGPVPEGAILSVKCRLYDSASGLALLWEEEHAVEVMDGAFILPLGDGTNVYSELEALLDDGKNSLLQLEIDGDALYPLKEINQAGKPFHAEGMLYFADIEDMVQTAAADVPYSPMLVLAGDTATVPFQFQVGNEQKYIRIFAHGSDLDILSTTKLQINHGNSVPVAIGEGGASDLTVSGRVGIGLSAPSSALHVKQPASAAAIRVERHENSNYWTNYIDPFNNYNFGFNGTGKSYIDDADGSYHVYSDMRLKKDIEPVDRVLSKAIELAPCRFHFQDELGEGRPKSLGFIAQQVEEVFPEIVQEKSGYKTLNYASFAVIAIAAIKEQQEQINALNEKILMLERLSKKPL